MTPITWALPKGRSLGPTLDLLEQAGLASARLRQEESRSLVIADRDLGMHYILARPADVPTYVEHGAADVGIVGKDILLEGGHQVYEVLDLSYIRCRFVVAAPAGADAAQLLSGATHLRIATKFPRVAEEYFRRRGLHAEIIYLHGSVEVAPQVGLADLIVDITETGRTLKENNLVEIDTILESTARLVVNRAAYRLKSERLGEITRALRLAAGLEPVSRGKG